MKNFIQVTTLGNPVDSLCMPIMVAPPNPTYYTHYGNLISGPHSNPVNSASLLRAEGIPDIVPVPGLKKLLVVDSREEGSLIPISLIAY